jgi:hypothetical protein
VAVYTVISNCCVGGHCIHHDTTLQSSSPKTWYSKSVNFAMSEALMYVLRSVRVGYDFLYLAYVIKSLQEYWLVFWKHTKLQDCTWRVWMIVESYDSYSKQRTTNCEVLWKCAVCVFFFYLKNKPFVGIYVYILRTLDYKMLHISYDWNLSFHTFALIHHWRNIGCIVWLHLFFLITTLTWPKLQICSCDLLVYVHLNLFMEFTEDCIMLESLYVVKLWLLNWIKHQLFCERCILEYTIIYTTRSDKCSHCIICQWKGNYIYRKVTYEKYEFF